MVDFKLLGDYSLYFHCREESHAMKQLKSTTAASRIFHRVLQGDATHVLDREMIDYFSARKEAHLELSKFF